MRLLSALALWMLSTSAMAGDPVMAFSGNGDTLEFSGTDIAEARAGNDAQTNASFITFRLTEEGSRKFGEFTERHLNRQVDLSLCGEVVSSPIIREPILGGTGVFKAFTEQQAEEWAMRLNLGKCAP